MLMIGQRAQQNQREKKIKKTQIYRQMLDHQILMNEQYRKEHSQKNRQKDRSLLSQHVLAPVVIQKSTESLQHSIVHEMDAKESQSKSRFLPLLKDKNTFYRGSSRFIKVGPGNKTINEARQYTQTKQIDEQQQSQLDYQYDSTCQRIIKQLQSIKDKPTKPRTRKRLYQVGEPTMHRRVHQKHLSNYQKHLQTSVPSMKTNLTNLTSNPENRYYQYLSTDLSNSEKTYNQFQQPKLEIKVNRNLTKINTPATDFKNYQRPERPYQDMEGLLSNELKKGKNHENKLKVSFMTNENYDITVKADKTNKIYEKTSQKSQESQLSVLPNRKPQKQQEKNSTLKKAKEGSNHKHLETQRQTFIELLRRVKNRGESLYLKFAKCSPQKQPFKT